MLKGIFPAGNDVFKVNTHPRDSGQCGSHHALEDGQCNVSSKRKLFHLEQSLGGVDSYDSSSFVVKFRRKLAQSLEHMDLLSTWFF